MNDLPARIVSTCLDPTGFDIERGDVPLARSSADPAVKPRPLSSLFVRSHPAPLVGIDRGTGMSAMLAFVSELRASSVGLEGGLVGVPSLLI